METMLADEKKLEELVEKTVQKHFKLAFENVEEVRKSPAVTLIRIEDRLNSLERRMERDMVTRAEFANARSEHKNEIANTRAELKDDIAKTRSELKDEITTLRTKDIKTLTQDITTLRTEVKDEIWKLRLLMILLGILVILTNPKVIELVGKLFGFLKP